MVRNVEPRGGSVQVTPPQQFSQRALALLERQVDDAIAQRAVCVEMLMAGVQVIDSAGLNWLLTAKSRLDVAGTELKLVDPSPLLRDVLIATRLESRFKIEHTAGGTRNA